MDKESGVYLTITDNSFQTPGVSGMKVLIPMVTTKGKLGLNNVNANNFKDILGYDLKYNSNYYGLGSILEDVSYAYVWRINQGAKLANAFFPDTSSGKRSDDDAEKFEEIINVEEKPALAAALKDVGNPETTAIKFTPTPDETTVINTFPTGSTPQEIVFDDVSETEVSSYNGKEIKGGCIFYNTSDNSIIGIIKPNYEGELRIYKVVDGEIVDDVMVDINTNIWKGSDNKFYTANGEETTEPSGDASEPVELGTVRRTTYEIHPDYWSFNGRWYNANIGEVDAPTGTAGTEVSLGEAYIYTGDTYPDLTPGDMYLTNDVGATFYLVNQLGTTFENTSKTLVTAEQKAALDELYPQDVFSNINYVPYTQDVDTGFCINNEGSWFYVTTFSTTMIVPAPNAITSQVIIDALDAASDMTISYIKYSDTVLEQLNAVGTAVWEESKLTLTLVNILSKDSYWNVKTIPVSPENWTMSIGTYDDTQFKTVNTYNISTNSESEIYWKNLEFKEIDLYIKANIPGSWEDVRAYFTLDNGSNGDPNLIAAELDTKIIETCGCNTIAMNGITNYKIVNKIAAKAEKFFIHTYVDVPAFAEYADAELWKKNLYRSEYLAIGGRPDQVEIAENEYIYVYPSVNYIYILSRMENNYQCLMYPPAGFTYGTIAVENLITCDYDNYGDELKTNRINWQRTKNRGSVMWEQRTNYALDTDLSYIAPVYIVDGLREQLIDFEEQFNFRYSSPTDLLNQESGIGDILDSYVTKGFIFRYELYVPTYAEAQAAGRTLTIKIAVAITKDSEVIIINLNLINA